MTYFQSSVFYFVHWQPTYARTIIITFFPTNPRKTHNLQSFRQHDKLLHMRQAFLKILSRMSDKHQPQMKHGPPFPLPNPHKPSLPFFPIQFLSNRIYRPRQ